MRIGCGRIALALVIPIRLAQSASGLAATRSSPLPAKHLALRSWRRTPKPVQFQPDSPRSPSRSAGARGFGTMRNTAHMDPAPRHEVARLLLEWKQGSRTAFSALMPLVEAELRRVAGGYANRTSQAAHLPRISKRSSKRARCGFPSRPGCRRARCAEIGVKQPA